MENPEDIFRNAEKRELPEFQKSALEQWNNVTERSDKISAQIAEAASKSPEKGRMLAEKAASVFSKIFRAGRLATFYGALALGAQQLQYNLTRYDVSETTTEDGKKEYTHQDRKTSAIIDFFSGKAELPEDIKLEIYRAHIMKFIKDMQVKIPQNFDKMTPEELGSFYLPLLNKHNKSISPGSEEEEVTMQQFLQDFGTEKPKYDENLYSALWEIEKLTGGSKIRISDPNQPIGRGGIAYSADSNTIHLNFNLERDKFISEAAHGVQFNSAPLSAWANNFKDRINTVIESARSGKSFQESYDLLYQQQGTQEYDAHNIVEKELKNKLPQD